MLERSDYYINVPPQDVSISGDILPVSDIDGKDHPLRAEDAFYLFEFLWRIGVYSNFSLPITNPRSLFLRTREKIIALDAYIVDRKKFQLYSGLYGLLDGDLTGVDTWKGLTGFIDWMCSSYMNTAVSGLDNSSLTWKPFDGDFLRRMYWWLNVKSKCWRFLENDSTHAKVDGKMFISYVSGLNNLSWIRWKSSSNVNPSPITENIVSDALIYTNSWEMQNSYDYGSIHGLNLQEIRDYSQTGSPSYIKRGGLLDDVEAVFRINRTDITDFVAFIRYQTWLNADYYYRTLAVPFVKVSDTDWKVKIWDNSVAMSLLSHAGYDTSVINGGPVSRYYPAPCVFSTLDLYAYKVSDKASLPSEWVWSPS